MIKLSKMETKEFLSVVFQHQELCDKLDNYINESEFDYINEKMRCFNFSCADWDIGCYNNNYLTVKNLMNFFHAFRKVFQILVVLNAFKSWLTMLKSCVAQIFLTTTLKMFAVCTFRRSCNQLVTGLKMYRMPFIARTLKSFASITI